LRIGGILSAKAKMYDTPGLLHPYLMSMRLNRDEQKMVEIRKELQPRTYRVKVSFPLISCNLFGSISWCDLALCILRPIRSCCSVQYLCACMCEPRK
jgi:hypothetical protein